MEQLVNNTPPKSISKNILSHASIINPSVPIEELPSDNFIRGCRTILHNVCTALAAYRLATAKAWAQLFTDGTSRRQVALLNLIVGLVEEDGFKSIVLSTSIIPENELSETQCDAIVAEFERCGRMLGRWKKVAQRVCPEYAHLIPDDKEMCISKFAKGGLLTTDGCNTAQKVRRLLKDSIEVAAREKGLSDNEILVLEVDCWNHLRNVWLGGVTKHLDSYWNMALKESLDLISFVLRVGTNFDGVLRALEKFFGECSNYPKGKGDIFCHWMRDYHPGTHLMPVERASGSRQDLAVEGAGALYLNRPYYIEFLHECLSADDSGHILQENMFVVLSSVEMIAYARVCAILHIAICLPTRWLAGNCHKLAAYGFSVRSMGNIVDELEKAMEEIQQSPDMFLSESFMMSIFASIEAQVPPLSEYMKYFFEDKQSNTVGRRSKTLPYDELRAELFYPQDETNQRTTQVVHDLAFEVATSMLAELRDERKATHNYLSSSDGRFSAENASAADHNACLGKKASNDDAERPFACLTGNLQWFGRLGLSNAGGVAQARVNGDFERDHGHYVRGRGKKGKEADGPTLGEFIKMPKQLSDSLLIWGEEEVSSTIKYTEKALKQQRDAKQQKKELVLEEKMKKATEEFILALYYYNMYNTEKCWMTEADVDKELPKIKSKSGQLKEIKEQIRIRVIGLGWSDLHTPWSEKGKPFLPEMLSTKLKEIIRQQKHRLVPTHPPPNLPKRKALPILGTLIPQVQAMDKVSAVATSKFMADAVEEKRRREDAGFGDSFAEIQPPVMPEIDSLVGRRIDKLFEYVEPGGEHVLQWCQGEVIDAPKQNSNIVVVRWDEQYCDNGNISETHEKLLQQKWNPKSHTVGAWRMDVSL